MRDRLWVKFLLILVLVSVIALSSAFVLRELMVQDFRGYLEGQIEDRATWITASLESTYEKYGVWPNPEIVENTVWALMLGFEMRLYDADGSFVIDTDGAANILSPAMKRRIMAISALRIRDQQSRFRTYSLVLNGREIGRIDLQFLRSQKELLFIRRSNWLLLFTLLGLGGVAVLLSFILSKKMTRPLEDLTDAVAAVSEGRLGHRVGIPGEDEIGRLSEAFNRMAHALELQESLRKKVTSNIAHELRTPVSVIQGELEGMMDGYIPVDREHIQSLHAEIGRFKTIIEGLEELARAEASSLSLRKQSFALEPFLRDILERHRKMFADKGVAQGLSCQEGLVISADPDRMSQVIINLLSNALKATGENGKVEVRALEKGSTVIVEVADTGVGIKQEDLPFIFERFYKAENGGLGLGLAIARELVQAHGGSITVNSDYGKGATFAVTLPR